MEQDYISTRCSFLTPYWNGAEMMEKHLESLRRFFPDSPVLISTNGATYEEMKGYKDRYGIQFWIEDVWYVEAIRRLFERCETQYAVICDHDTIFLSDFSYLFSGLGSEYNMVGIEEKIHHPWADTWMRNRPGYTDLTFVLFDIQKFKKQYGWEGFEWRAPKEIQDKSNSEYHYGLCEKLRPHKYLIPYHIKKYGMGNLIKDGDKNILWHQWYGSWRLRPITDKSDRVASFGGKDYLEKGEMAFLKDYPNLDFHEATPA